MDQHILSNPSGCEWVRAGDEHVIVQMDYTRVGKEVGRDALPLGGVIMCFVSGDGFIFEDDPG